jgi:CheY-like chemotaxis protein
LEQQTLMVVDDDEDIIFLISAQLRRLGYNVVTCEEPHNLLKELAEKKPDLVLLDISLRTANGADLCKRIKRNPEFSDIGVYLMSGNMDIEEHVKRSNADGSISKPLSFASIEQSLSSYFNKEV